MGTVSKVDLPPQSLLHGYMQPEDFVDCYSCTTTLDVDGAAAQAMYFPGWVGGLMVARNALALPLGLKTSVRQGETLGYFPVETRNANEIILGFNDKHLNFRISILTDGMRAFGATWVHRNNWLGRAYLAAVMPFHITIMRHAMSRVAQ